MQSSDSSLFSVAYLPPVSYIKACLRSKEIILESREHFIKQTYRNRCHIYGANGLLSLVIPVSHSELFTKPISLIDTISEEPWKRIHWRSITSAYRNSPFFEYYEEDLKVLFHSPEINLFKFNLECLSSIFKLLNIRLHFKLTENFEKIPSIQDLRYAFHPKLISLESFPRYHQVFEERFAFLPDLSILDLLCNLGPDSADYLMK